MNRRCPKLNADRLRPKTREQISAIGYVLVSPDNELILRTVRPTRDMVWASAPELMHACKGTLKAAGFICARVYLNAVFDVREPQQRYPGGKNIEDE